MDKPLSKEELCALISESSFKYWQEVSQRIEEKYDMEILLFRYSGKKWDIEKKYRRGGKTLCGFYAKTNDSGFMIIFGKDEREKFEKIRNQLTLSIQTTYDQAETYHDGKWVMFNLDADLLHDLDQLLAIKRRPNRK